MIEIFAHMMNCPGITFLYQTSKVEVSHQGITRVDIEMAVQLKRWKQTTLWEGRS